jgi:hypothetical protein
MKWLWLNGAGFALATAYYGRGVSGLERLTLLTLAFVALWIFDWRSYERRTPGQRYRLPSSSAWRHGPTRLKPVRNFSKAAAFLSVERYSGHEAERREVLSCRGAEVPEGRSDG